MPAPAVRAEAFDDPVLNHLNRLRLGQVDYLARVIEALTLQAILAVGAAFERMLDGFGRGQASAAVIVLGCALLALAFGSSRCGTIGLDEGRRVAMLLFQFSNALLSGSQLFQQLCELLLEFLVFGSQPLNFLLKYYVVMNTIDA